MELCGVDPVKGIARLAVKSTKRSNGCIKKCCCGTYALLSLIFSTCLAGTVFAARLDSQIHLTIHYYRYYCLWYSLCVVCSDGVINFLSEGS